MYAVKGTATAAVSVVLVSRVVVAAGNQLKCRGTAAAALTAFKPFGGGPAAAVGNCDNSLLRVVVVVTVVPSAMRGTGRTMLGHFAIKAVGGGTCGGRGEKAVAAAVKFRKWFACTYWKAEE